MDLDDDQTKFTCEYFFVEQYGLLGGWLKQQSIQIFY